MEKINVDNIKNIIEKVLNEKMDELDKSIKSIKKSNTEEMVRLQDSINSLKDDVKNIKNKQSIMQDSIESLKRDMENIKYKQNINTVYQTPPTYMDALSDVSITGGIRNINSHYLD